MVEQGFKLGKRSVLDINSPEYQWVRMLHADGMDKNMINTTIIRCLGGDAAVADTFRRVALKEAPPATLLELVVPQDCLWD